MRRKRREALVKQNGPARLLTDRDANPAKPAPGEYFEHRELHPFIRSFRPGPG